MGYRLGISETISVLPNDLKKSFTEITKGLDTSTFFAADNWNKQKTKQFEVKMSANNIDLAVKKLLAPDVKRDPKGRQVRFGLNGYKILFLESKKTASSSDAESTKKQELASLWIIRKALKPSPKVYENIDELKKDPTSKELFEIYPELVDNVVWLKGLIAQQKTILKYLKQNNYTEFDRDKPNGFMNYISEVVKMKFGISKKDAWNPADIWVIKDENKVRREIKEASEGAGASLNRLNETMRKQWKEKRLKGISLKAVSGSVARWEEVNVDELLFTESGNKVFELDYIKCALNLKGDSFSSTDTIINVKEGSSHEYKFQIRQNSKGFSNLKFEPTMRGAGAARLGKVPLDMLKTMMITDYGINENKFSNNWRTYPSDISSFNSKYAQFENMWKQIKNKVETGITTTEEFKESFQSAFMSQPDIASSKLMQIKFIHAILSIGADDRDDMLTNMVFLAMKKGSRFGPFGKLY